MTGARIATTLINGLQSHDKPFGLVFKWIGDGQGMAMIIERLSSPERRCVALCQREC
jgi:acetyl-CoA C-acetyltransferase